jgi:hypothetical protein
MDKRVLQGGRGGMVMILLAAETAEERRELEVAERVTVCLHKKSEVAKMGYGIDLVPENVIEGL